MSYLNPLRLHFAGTFQAAPSTVNNDPAHFDNETFLARYQQYGPKATDGWWNPRGNADFRLIGCKVTAAWQAGKPVAGDSILQCLIDDSNTRVAGKLVDLDAEQQMVSEIFTGDPGYQVTKGFPSTELIAVHDVQSATTAIETIVEQGEGTRTSPLDPQHRPAHYYRYAEILHGKALVPNATPPPDFAYAGEAIQFDSGGVYPVVTNPAVPGYTPGSAAAINNDTFNYTYTSLLNTLHIVFNGQPGQLTAAIGLMESLKELAFAMMSAIPADPTKPGFNAGPSFEYKPTNP